MWVNCPLLSSLPPQFGFVQVPPSVTLIKSLALLLAAKSVEGNKADTFGSKVPPNKQTLTTEGTFRGLTHWCGLER